MSKPEIKVIYRGDMLKAMNHALMNKMTVTFKAWKVGKSEKDPERGTVKVYDGVYVTSHSKTGTYKVRDPLAENEAYRFRNVSEALVFEFMGKRVIW